MEKHYSSVKAKCYSSSTPHTTSADCPHHTYTHTGGFCSHRTNMWQVGRHSTRCCLFSHVSWGCWCEECEAFLRSLLRRVKLGSSVVIGRTEWRHMFALWSHTSQCVCVLLHVRRVCTNLHSYRLHITQFPFEMLWTESFFFDRLLYGILLGLSGVYLTDSEDMSPPEGRSDVSHKPKEKAWWPSRLRSEAPRGPAHKRGPDNEQYHPKTNLPRQDMHHIPTRTVVILKVYIDDLSGFKVYGNKNSNIYFF